MTSESHARERLFERAREYSTQRETWAEADRLWVTVIDAYRHATTGDRVDRKDQQQLARALWRRAMLLPLLGRAAEGMTPGREAVTIFRQINEAVTAEHADATAPPRDQALAELITAMADLGEISFAAGDPTTRLELLDQALAQGLSGAGPPATAGPQTNRAMGTAFHNQAIALMHQLGSQPSTEAATAAALAASRATSIRLNLIDLADPLTVWELVNTQVVYAQCLTLIGDFDRAEMVVRFGQQGSEILGPVGADLRRKLDATATIVAAKRRR